MSKVFLVLLVIARHYLGKCVTDETELISTVLVYRHGDRTPLLSRSELSTNPEAVEAASAPFGYGQLTNVGKRRCYKLGKTIRARYNSLLSQRYNKSEIYIRSTDFTRTKMSVLAALAAIYPAYPGSWSDEINWVPTPYTTVPAKYDFFLFSLNCPKYLILKNSNSSSRIDKYLDLLKITAASSGHKLKSTPAKSLFILYDIYINQVSLGIPLSPEIAEIMPQLKEAADVAIDILFGNNDLISLQGGVMLNEFFTQADKLIAGADTPRVRMYSAHDSSVYSFEAAAQVYPRQGVPQYAAYFALELRMIMKTGEYVVLPVYQSNPSDEVVYLHVAGCGENSFLCPYDTFKKLLSKYTLSEDSWKTQCGFTKDLVIDQSSIN